MSSIRIKLHLYMIVTDCGGHNSIDLGSRNMFVFQAVVKLNWNADVTDFAKMFGDTKR